MVEIKTIVYGLLIALGLFSFLMISHETYHYFSIDGDATGVCFGKCSLGDTYEGISDDTWAVSSIHWEMTQEQMDNLDLVKEEKYAWTFSIILTLILIGFIFYWEAIE